MAMGTSAHPKHMWPGVKKWFGDTYNEHPVEYTQIYDSETSSKGYEEYVQNKPFGLATVKGQGEPVDFEDTEQGYISRITNVVYGIGGNITREAIEDGQYEPLSSRIARYLAFSIRQTEENVGANVLNRAFSSSYVGGDGVALISASHPDGPSGTQSNILAVAADLSETSLEDILIQIMLAEDSKGNKISLIGRKLIIPPQLLFKATRILKSLGQSDTANNDINALRNLGMLPDGKLVCHYLTDTDAWFIKTNAPDGMIVQNRRAVEFTKDNEFQTENAMMKATIRKGFGWGDWRCMYASAGG